MKGGGPEVVAGTASEEGRKEQRWLMVVALSWTGRPLSHLFQKENVRVLAHSSCESFTFNFWHIWCIRHWPLCPCYLRICSKCSWCPYICSAALKDHLRFCGEISNLSDFLLLAMSWVSSYIMLKCLSCSVSSLFPFGFLCFF